MGLAAARSAAYEIHQRLWVENPDGAMVDLSDWLVEASGDTSLEEPVDAATLTLHRADSPTQSLALLMSGSLLNRDAQNQYAPLLHGGRRVLLEVATVLPGAAVEASDWVKLFEGYLVNPEWGDGEEIVLSCFDLGWKLQKQWVEEKDEEYGSVAGTPAPVVIQQLLDRWLGSEAPTLYVPTATPSVVTPFKQQKMSLLDACKAVAQISGDDVRYLRDPVTGEPRLTFFRPNRAPPGNPAITFSADEYETVPLMGLPMDDVRNVVDVTYTDSATGMPDTIRRESAISIAKWRHRLYTELEFGSESPINTPAEATTLAENALSDMEDPGAEHEIELAFNPYLNVGDYYGFAPNAVHYDVPQVWGAMRHAWHLAGGDGTSRLYVRGKVAGTYRSWIPGLGTGPDGLALYDVQERRSQEEVLITWRRGQQVAAVRVFEGQHAQPVPPSPFGGDGMGLSVLGGEDAYTAQVPAPHHLTFVQLEPVSAAGEVGPVIRLVIEPSRLAPEEIPIRPPSIRGILQVGTGVGVVSVYGFVADSVPNGGQLRVWVRPGSQTSPDPTAVPDGIQDYGPGGISFGPDTPFALSNGTTATLLRDITYHPARPKHIYLEYVTLDGRSSGQEALLLQTHADSVIDALGALRAGSIRSASAFAEGMTAVGVGADLPTDGTEFKVWFRTSENPPRLYNWNELAQAWEYAAPDLDIPPGGITETHIADDAISTPKLRANAVQAYHILAGEILARLLTTDQITAGAISAGAINTQALAAGAVTAIKVAAAAIETGHLAAGAVTADKVSVNQLSDISGAGGIMVSTRLVNSLTTPTRWLDLRGDTTTFLQHEALQLMQNGTATFFGSAPNVLADANAYTDAAVAGGGSGTGNITIRASTAPTVRPGGTPLIAGDRWLNTADGDLPYAWSGSVWIREYTRISGGNIVTGSIDAALLSAQIITADKYIRSSNYAAGSAGWQINGAGDAELNNVTVRGTIAAGSIIAAASFTASTPVFTGWLQVPRIQMDKTGSDEWIGLLHSGLYYGALRPSLSASNVREVNLDAESDLWLRPGNNAFNTGAVKIDTGKGGLDLTNNSSVGGQWRWHHHQPSGDLRLSKPETTLRYYFQSNGQAYADLGWSTFSPEPPMAKEQMEAGDWIGWAGEDAGKPNKPYSGIPTPENPAVIERARERGVTPEQQAAADHAEYGKDISKIAIGTAEWAKHLQQALRSATTFAAFKRAILNP